MDAYTKKILGDVFCFLLIAGAGGMFGYMSFAFFSERRFDSSRVIQDSELSRAIRLATRTKECSELVGQDKEDIAKIHAALKQCDKDVIANNNESKLEQQSYQFFQSMPLVPKHIQYGRLENRIEMADTITDLLNHYPSLSMGTLEDLNASWDDWEEHHTKVVELVKEYLPETYACLNESKLRQGSGQLVV